MQFSDSLQLAKLLLLIAVVVVCSATDLRSRRIPNPVLLAALMSALFLNGLADGVAGIADSIAGLGIGLLMLVPLHVLGRMGAGDVKLLGVVGSILGAWGAVVAGLATMMAGAILGIAYVAWVVVKPRLIALTARAAHSGSKEGSSPGVMPSRTVRAAEIPYALAIAGGTFAALFYLDLLTEVGIT